MTALKARLYEPPPADRPVRSFMSLVRRMLEGDRPDWPELVSGDRGIDISRCRFRDLGTATDPGGGYVAKSSQPATFFDTMLAASVVGRAGGKTDQPNGDWSSVPTVATVGELAWTNPDGGSVDETSMTFASRARRARLGTFSIDFTRNLRVETGGLTERILLSEGARVCAAGLDKGSLVGTGVDNQPLGILSAPIPSTSGATFSTTTAAELLRIVEAANGTPSAFMLSPAGAKLLRTRPRFTGTDTPILSNGKIADLPAFVTTAMPDDEVLLGDFSRLTVCSEKIEILIDPYTDATSGKISLRFYLFADVIIEHASAFAVATSVS